MRAAKPVIERRLAEVQAKKASGSFIGLHVRPPLTCEAQDALMFTDAVHLERCFTMGNRGEYRERQSD
jgi:hypothetical protein